MQVLMGFTQKGVIKVTGRSPQKGAHTRVL